MISCTGSEVKGEMVGRLVLGDNGEQQRLVEADENGWPTVLSSEEDLMAQEEVLLVVNLFVKVTCGESGSFGKFSSNGEGRLVKDLAIAPEASISLDFFLHNAGVMFNSSHVMRRTNGILPLIEYQIGKR